MTKDWIIDVLGDLRGFARANGLPTLAEELEGALAVAALEIAQPPTGQAERDGAETGRLAESARMCG
ncbi:hypothetical protein [Jannaschia donghaensis]|uniref:Uncharacterized protein n=1 Tax=Jannaschia donghaensis TaxID=420998 RepID=A0A0M6YGC4_9RHOB|nr:hypothetical protein [Jannaschia donghaensis]CTQ48984.1 hypothetical protein JDO7802_00992 [Jannaschia donghaensis]